MDTISFITKYSNSFYKIKLSKTLLNFIEFDYSYFWEQAIALGKHSKKNNDFPYDQSHVLKNLISKSHPYFEALINYDFDYIVVDCIIEHICRKEGIGLEALWARCISPKNSYEKVLFTRISEYKTKRAINQWVNLMRMQEYAKTKLAFIFDGEPCSLPECKARCKYFDLAYSVVATETGYPSEELPAVKRFSITQMPNSVFMINKASKDIYKRLAEKLDNAPEPSKLRINDITRNSYAMDSFEYIKDLTRAPEFEMYAAIENFRNFPDVVYLPNCFKALIDLEIEKMLENGIMLLKCENCGKYFKRDINYSGKLCNRVNSSGKSCREQAEENIETEPNIEDELNRKSDEMYSALYSKIGQEIPKNEFNDWSEYLSRLKNNIKTQNATLDDLESFLTYTEKMYGEIKIEDE